MLPLQITPALMNSLQAQQAGSRQVSSTETIPFCRSRTLPVHANDTHKCEHPHTHTYTPIVRNSRISLRTYPKGTSLQNPQEEQKKKNNNHQRRSPQPPRRLKSFVNTYPSAAQSVIFCQSVYLSRDSGNITIDMYKNICLPLVSAHTND